MKKHIIKIYQTTFLELGRISSIHRFLTEDATKTLATSYILSWIDYCNCLLMGAPSSVIQPLQKVKNFTAWLILMAPGHHHSTPLLKKLHWLPISELFKYKIACMCFHAINGSSPTYLSEILNIYTPSCMLRSSSDSCMLEIQQYNARLMALALSLTLDPMFGIHSHLTSGNAQLCHLLKWNWKLFFFHSTSISVNFRSRFSLSESVSLCVCINANVCVCVLMLMCVFWCASFICLLGKLLCICVLFKWLCVCV